MRKNVLIRSSCTFGGSYVFPARETDCKYCNCLFGVLGVGLNVYEWDKHKLEEIQTWKYKMIFKLIFFDISCHDEEWQIFFLQGKVSSYEDGKANIPNVSDVSMDRFNSDVCEQEASNFTLYYHDRIHVRSSLMFLNHYFLLKKRWSLDFGIDCSRIKFVTELHFNFNF